MDSRHGTKSGFVAIAGRPNVGKSTLLNSLVGARLAITTPKPQTTRNRILGILTRGQMQAVFLDTPGIHRARGGINRRMVQTAVAAIAETDIVLHMVEAGAPIDDTEKLIASETAKTKAPTFLVINKIDLIGNKKELLPEIERLSAIGEFSEIVPISAKKGDGIDLLVKLVEKHLPQGPHLYPPEDYTDLTERFLAGEMIREQIIINTRQEIPYATAVTVEEFEEKENIVRIRARIHVESKSQKGVVIGAGGSMLKKIGSGARGNIERMTGIKVYLELFVDVLPKWTRDDKMLDMLGYEEK